MPLTLTGELFRVIFLIVFFQHKTLQKKYISNTVYFDLISLRQPLVVQELCNLSSTIALNLYDLAPFLVLDHRTVRVEGLFPMFQ